MPQTQKGHPGFLVALCGGGIFNAGAEGEHPPALFHSTAAREGSITVWLTSCLNGSDLTKQVKLFFIQHKQSS